MPNRHLVFLFIVLNACFFATGQGTREIRSVYKRIQKGLDLYTSKTIPVFEMSTEGGEVTGYYKDSTIQKLSAVFFRGIGKVVSGLLRQGQKGRICIGYPSQL